MCGEGNMAIENIGSVEENQVNRRSFLQMGLATAVSLALPTQAFGRYADYLTPERTLSFYNTHTGEYLNRHVYWSEGNYLRENLQDINYILRDHRTGDVKEMDPALMDLLFGIQSRLGTKTPINIISGYRSEATNAMLNRKSSGVAKKSYHMTGKAIDIRIPGVDLRSLYRTARVLKGGGVGYYSKSNFVHVDTGRVRCW